MGGCDLREKQAGPTLQSIDDFNEKKDAPPEPPLTNQVCYVRICAHLKIHILFIRARLRL
jgi:hypothetical protein